MSAPVGVAQVVDTLDPGGLERFARDVANLLPRARFRPHLITTRRAGPLADGLAEDVATLHLGRRRRFDPGAVLRLRRYVERHGVRILHAHGHSAKIAALAGLGRADVHLVWHLHSGAWASRDRPSWTTRWLARRASRVLTVTEALADWCREALGLAADRVTYLPNFLVPAGDVAAATDLPGTPRQRVVAVGNLRPEKDHATLIGAFARAAAANPEAHLLVVGGGEERATLERRVAAEGLAGRVSLLGRRDDVPAILRASRVGVLSSRSEGFPLTLLEYADAGLPTIATQVGQCAEILGEGAAGILVPPGDVEALADALRRGLAGALDALGPVLRDRVATRYRAAAILARIADCYEATLRGPRP